MSGMEDKNRGDDPSNDTTGTKGAIDAYTGASGTPMTTEFGASGSTIGVGYHIGRRIWEEATYHGGRAVQATPSAGMPGTNAPTPSAGMPGTNAPTPSAGHAEAIHVNITSGVSIVALLQSGRTDAWKDFTRELYGARHEEYEASRRRLGVTHESVMLVPTTQGDMTITYIEADEPQTLFTRMSSSSDPFDIWFGEQVKQLYGLDIKNPPATATHLHLANDSVFEWQAY